MYQQPPPYARPPVPDPGITMLQLFSDGSFEDCPNKTAGRPYSFENESTGGNIAKGVCYNSCCASIDHMCSKVSKDVDCGSVFHVMVHVSIVI